MKKWFVYILECSDKTLYTGITIDIKRRLVEHNSGRGARYTRSRRPVTIIYTMELPDRSTASKMELKIKKLPRKKKLELVNSTGASHVVSQRKPI